MFSLFRKSFPFFLKKKKLKIPRWFFHFFHFLKIGFKKKIEKRLNKNLRNLFFHFFHFFEIGLKKIEKRLNKTLRNFNKELFLLFAMGQRGKKKPFCTKTKLFVENNILKSKFSIL